MEMHPTQEDVVRLFTQTGAYREGHFVLSNGKHTNVYLQPALAMQYVQVARTLSVGLSRRFRGIDKVMSALSELTIISPPSGGIPVAYYVASALLPARVLWAESANGKLTFRPYVELRPDAPCILVDDVMRSGTNMRKLLDLVQGLKANVLSIGVIVDQSAESVPLDGIHFHALARIKPTVHASANQCPLCKQGIPSEPARDI